MSKELHLIRKIKAVAERGVGGEKVNAEKMLLELMRKHGITFDQIETEEEKEFEFNHKSEPYLFAQVVLHVMGHDRGTVFRPRGKSNLRYIKCTYAEKIEIEAKFAFYLNQYRKEQDILYQAFVQRNQIFPAEVKTIDVQQMTPEEYKEYQRIKAMMQAIEKSHYNKQLK